MSQEKKAPMLVSEVERELFRHVENTIGDKAPASMPNPLARTSKIFNFYPGQYTLIGSITGVGKTSFIDHNMLYILESIPLDSDFHIEFLYLSMERKKKIKFAKWISWKMFHTSRSRISAKQILNKDRKLTDAQLTHLRAAYTPWLNKILKRVDLREGQISPARLEQIIDKKAKLLGVHYHSDDDTIYKFEVEAGKFDPNNYIETDYGRKLYVIIKIGDKNYTLYQNDSIYVTKTPTALFIIMDHVGKFKMIKGGKKATLDLVDDILCYARDSYSFSPIPISQFNRDISKTDRLKYNQGDLDPVLEDFKDTGNMTESADVVLSLFDPAKYKSWDGIGNYKGYNIRDATITPDKGQQRARSLHVIKNSEDSDNLCVVLRFTGESGYFEEMPIPEDTEGLQKVYNEIMQGK